jgi:hypothetical protein
MLRFDEIKKQTTPSLSSAEKGSPFCEQYAQALPIPNDLGSRMLRSTPHDVCDKDGMCDPLVRQGPEGRPPNVSPTRKGWVRVEDDPERRRCGTLWRTAQRLGCERLRMVPLQ